MKKSANPIIKFGTYLALGFFTVIIIINFGMPDSAGCNSVGANDAASVNGHKITHLQVNRFIKMRLDDQQNQITPEVTARVLDYLVNMELDFQYAKNSGIDISNAAADKMINRNFTDEKGTFSDDRMKRFMENFRFTLKEYHQSMKKELIRYELNKLVEFASAVSKDEIQFANIVRNSDYQIKFVFIPNRDLTEKYKDKVNVTEDEITKELKNNPGEVRDPETDRTRIKNKLQTKKLDLIKTELINSLNAVSEKGGKIEESAAILGARVMSSAPYKIGAKISEESNPENVLTGLMMSDIYTDGIINLEVGKTSKAVNSIDGIYVFSPSKKELLPIDVKSEIVIKNDLFEQKKDYMYTKLIADFSDKAKIRKNRKMFEQEENSQNTGN
ncbi:MAG: SurA N-terminal domain-containing protein [Spirochaetes bacterium]|nr:SurA N-terminal domain-containing protein [Spirochaetota bacterium]